MKKYPSIPHWNQGILGTYVYAFDKIDGSNLRFEWSRKLSKKANVSGFGKFGSRNQLIYKDNKNWGKAIEIFYEKYAEKLDRIFREDKYFQNAKKITVFCEFHGKNSFAGWHDPNDEMDLTLFDVDIYQKGIMAPRDFIKKFSELGIPKIIYQGMYNQSLIDDVKNNVYGLVEGVVVKGIILTKKKGVENTWMIKIKTNDWLSKVKTVHGEKKLLEELNGDQSLMI